ncbi:xanthine dehydrogenase subunit E [Paenibacillus sambharensis]|uniref:Xanthine dehydrogenase subunit E n=1 Tax=Paenibacillus sambharensis TaxID=1803190 RepID=A0A2W1LMI2_9BACL|nr:(2Fe-2S)-binding protein [Paenibacillus sambharensis]PZD96095.1 xanthine dehydrogenase subunit E [Paenibacillus sambharensis]
MNENRAAERPAAPGTELYVNGNRVTVCTEPSKRLLHVLRDELQMTGAKRSCEIGRCGACMVLLDGRPVNACLTMLYQCGGRTVTTIEGIAPQESGGLDPVQQAFLEEGGYQCGYCTPGMIISVKALLDFIPDPTDEEITEALSGNICRCTGYGGIIRSVRRASELKKISSSDA